VRLVDLYYKKAMLVIYNTFFRAQPEDGSVGGSETCCWYK